MKTRKSTYKCGHCNYSSLKIIKLHEHLLDHSGCVGYFFDFGHKTAFPKWKYDDSLIRLNAYTSTEEGVSIEQRKDYLEIKDKDSTLVKTELVEVDIDEDISDICLEFLEENPTFNGTGSSEVPDVYSKPDHYLHSLSLNNVQIKKHMIGYKKKPKKQNKRKQLKRAQRKLNKICTTDIKSQSVVSVQSDTANEDYLAATDIIGEDDKSDGNNFPFDKFEK